MVSKIEQGIEEIELFLEECKPTLGSSTMIKVNKDELESLLQDLKSNTPEEIRQYQKIIANQDRIIATAEEKARKIVSDAQIKNDKLVSEHQVMLQAYQKADEVVRLANAQAAAAIDEANREATEIRKAAISYTDSLLAEIQQVLSGSISITKQRDQEFLGTLQGYLDTVDANRASLLPETVMSNGRGVANGGVQTAGTMATGVQQAAAKSAGGLDVPNGFFNKNDN